MKIKNKAFTLTELLVALGIIGAIAAISIPSLVTKIQNRMLVTKLKSTNQAIKQLVDKTLITSPTRDLSGTDFDDPDKLLTSSNFDIVTTCSDAAKDCWRTTATTGVKVQYRLLSGNNTSIAGPTYKSIILKNGAVIGYKKSAHDHENGDATIGEFCYDVNGTDKPNMSGRDYFCTFVTKKGKLVDMYYPENRLTIQQKTTKCTNGSGSNYCYGAIVNSGWKMPY